MDLKNLGEFGLIACIDREFRAPDGVTGIGDDCAVIPQRTGLDTLVSTDMLMEGTHFLMEDISPRRLGWKSAAVNISDIAAMGGKPTSTFLSFALPKTLSGEWMEEFIAGYKAVSDLFGVPLLGGDTTSSPDRLCINVTVLGECPHGTARMRSQAVLGDLVCVTGHLGDSAGGLNVILKNTVRDAMAEYLIERHYLPMPRVNEGIKLATVDGVHAMMDVSDGIGSDLRHILKASGVGAEIDMRALPLSDELKAVCAREGWDAAELAVSGGEDYELLFTVAPEAEKLIDVEHTVIGKIVAADSISWVGGEKDYIGFRHF